MLITIEYVGAQYIVPLLLLSRPLRNCFCLTAKSNFYILCFFALRALALIVLFLKKRTKKTSARNCISLCGTNHFDKVVIQINYLPLCTNN